MYVSGKVYISHACAREKRTFLDPSSTPNKPSSLGLIQRGKYKLGSASSNLRHKLLIHTVVLSLYSTIDTF